MSSNKSESAELKQQLYTASKSKTLDVTYSAEIRQKLFLANRPKTVDIINNPPIADIRHGVLLGNNLSSRRSIKVQVADVDIPVHHSDIVAEFDRVADNAAHNEPNMAHDEANIMQDIYPHSFAYPLLNLPTLKNKDGRISYEYLLNVKHLLNGSNSNIYKATYMKTHVIVKIIQQDPHDIAYAEKEFRLEHEILMRISNENIVGYYGGGTVNTSVIERRFLVLERLNFGTLVEVMKRHAGRHKSYFTHFRVLEIASDFANALNYLHYGFHSDITIIHRDLKPDNIGFTDTGKLKLMDFGLSAIVQRRTSSTEKYAMTGNTGSLRYMAPEIYLEQPYTELVDMYSYGLIIWHAITGIPPYQGYSKSDFLPRVFTNKERPSLNLGPASAAIGEILDLCWRNNYEERPTSSEVYANMRDLLREESKQMQTRQTTSSACCCAMSR